MRIFKTLLQMEIKQVAAENEDTESQCKSYYTLKFYSERRDCKNPGLAGKLRSAGVGIATGQQGAAEVGGGL